MSAVLVSGLINVETTVRVDGFPIPYTPVRYPFGGVNSTVSGVGYNVAKALLTLGDEVRLVSLIGRGLYGELVRRVLGRDGLSSEFVLQRLTRTPQSAIFYDGTGRRQINVDLKDVQTQPYPLEAFERALHEVDWAVLCNVNFSRAYLARVRERGIPIATDVHAISDLEDDYNRDFMEAADILFMSDEYLPTAPEDWARAVMERYAPEILVIGLGARGALLGLREEGKIEHTPAVPAPRIVSTIGAGDALFAAFLHVYRQTRDPRLALRKACVFASEKLGAAGAAEGFLTERMLEARYRQLMAA
ncbi:MAG: carbohydrate kinase family protein [Anaerolineae bacterium]